MSQENVEIVREVMRLFSEPGPAATERLRELFAADVHVDMSRRVFNPDTYDGHEGLLRLGRETSSAWSAFTLTPERVIDAGDRVIVIETRRGRGRTSGIEVEQRSSTVWTLRSGQVVRMETDVAPAEALKAVGSTE
ncbi:MAG TPA: nuclear transport factor 2 family protein [Solirubrobacteraceae bacterium]|nr:nuclear transport factor 2 family protein [Solirubrobacteraceae bacterium]